MACLLDMLPPHLLTDLLKKAHVDLESKYLSLAILFKSRREKLCLSNFHFI